MAGEIRVTFEPGERISAAAKGTVLLLAAHAVDVGIESGCAGHGTCGMCRVRVTSGQVGVSAADRDHFSAEELEAGWRLACQARVREDTSCWVPEPAGAPRAAVSGQGREIPVEPDVHRVLLRLPEPSLEDPAGDLERLRRELVGAGHGVTVDSAMLRALPGLLRRHSFQLTAVVAGGRLLDLEPGDTREATYAVAVDMGTTSVVGILLNLGSGAEEAVRSALNGQALFGADVISRIGHAMVGEEERLDLQRSAVSTLNAVLASLCQASGVSRDRVYEIVVVGNATMTHLLLGVDPSSIAAAPFVPAFSGPMDVKAAELGVEIHPRGRLVVLPAIGAYVGADIVSGLHATGLAHRSSTALFIDVGTNSEIAIGSRDRVVATAAPAGPAFEGGCLRAGMRASEGAIDRVTLSGDLEIGVVGSGSAQGICGSGLIDAVAVLLQAGLLEPSGRLKSREAAGDHPLAYRLVEADGRRAFRLTERIAVTQRDIRELQVAKGAVATAVEVLLGHLGIGPGELDEILLAGAFGAAIDPASAQAIGLVPDLPVERVRFVGNAALEGARMATLSFRERQMAFALPSRVEYVELSARPDFNELFLGNLAFPCRTP